MGKNMVEPVFLNMPGMQDRQSLKLEQKGFLGFVKSNKISCGNWLRNSKWWKRENTEKWMTTISTITDIKYIC